MNRLSIIAIIIGIIAAGGIVSMIYYTNQIGSKEAKVAEECLSIKEAVINLSFEDAQITEDAADTLAELYCNDEELQRLLPKDRQEYELRTISFACELIADDLSINLTRIDEYKDILKGYKDVYCSNISSVIIAKAEALSEMLNDLKDQELLTAQQLINDAISLADTKPYTAYTKLDMLEDMILEG